MEALASTVIIGIGALLEGVLTYVAVKINLKIVDQKFQRLAQQEKIS